MSVDQFSYLWAAPPGTYVLERFEVGGDEVLLIVHQVNQMVELIDDETVHQQVVQRMLDSGVPVVDE